MESLRAAGFVDRDTIVIHRYPKVLRMLGQIGCKGNIVVTVEKLLEITSDGEGPLIQTVRYSSHAQIRNGHNILRYDNQHTYPGHQDEHHKHTFALWTGDEQESSPAWIGRANWPTLGDVLRELMDWHSHHYDDLANPDVFATPEKHVGRLQLGFDW
jgi:hypothetical protein